MVVEGIPLDPGMGLTGWMTVLPQPAAKPGGALELMALGEMVLLEGEVAPALAELKKQGFQVESDLGPFRGGSPTVERLYFSGQGLRWKMGPAVQALNHYLSRSQPRVPKTPTSVLASPTPTPHPLKGAEALWAQVEGVLGPGQRQGQLLHYSYPWNESVSKDGVELPRDYGVVTEFHFQKVEGLVEGGKGPLGLSVKGTQPVVAVTGQFALRAGEVELVRDILSRHGATIEGTDRRWTGLLPDLVFADFWVVGRPIEVAQTLKTALEAVNNSRPKETPTPAH